MRQTTTAKVRLDAGKAARFSASGQSTDWFDSCCACGARFTVAHDGRRGDPWPHNHAESGECRLKPCVFRSVDLHQLAEEGPLCEWLRVSVGACCYFFWHASRRDALVWRSSLQPGRPQLTFSRQAVSERGILIIYTPLILAISAFPHSAISTFQQRPAKCRYLSLDNRCAGGRA